MVNMSRVNHTYRHYHSRAVEDGGTCPILPTHLSTSHGRFGQIFDLERKRNKIFRNQPFASPTFRTQLNSSVVVAENYVFPYTEAG